MKSFLCAVSVRIALFLFFIGASFLVTGQVVINEVMSENETTLTDEDGDYSDWIELYNTGSDTVN